MKKLLSLLLLLVLSLTVVSCAKDETVEYTHPTISNPEEVILTSTNNSLTYKVTKADLYHSILDNGGLNLVLEALDSELLASYVQSVTDAELESKYNRVVHSTEVLDTLTPSEINENIDNYTNQMKVMGFRNDSIQTYLKFLAGREKYALKVLTDAQADKKSDYYVEDETLKAYYEENCYTDAKAIVVNFMSSSDYKSTIQGLGYVTYNSELRKYTGTTPIADVLQADLDDTNTKALNDAELKAAFIELYNAVYPYRTQLTDATLLTDTHLDYNFEVLSAQDSTLASFLFSLEKNEYTYAPYKSSTSYETVYSLVYKLTDGLKDYYDLTSAEREAVLNKYLVSLSHDADTVSNILVELRKDNGLTFYDRYLANAYKSYDAEVKVEAKGDQSKVLKCGDVELTADELYDYAKDPSEAYYMLGAATQAIQQTLKSYEIAYGLERDLDKNGSLRYISNYDAAIKTLDQYKANYDTDEECLYTYFGATNLRDAVKYTSVRSDLDYLAMLDYLLTVDETGKATFNKNVSNHMESFLNDAYSGYYDLTPYLLVVYTDYDGDFRVDSMEDVVYNPSEYGLELTQDEYEAVLKELYDIFYALFDDAESASDVAEAMQDFVTKYKKASRVSGPYAKYKNLGIHIGYSKPSVSGSSYITYFNYASDTTDNMNELLKELYADITDGTFDSFVLQHVTDTLVVDENCAYFGAAAKGSSTSRPKFAYDKSTDTDNKYNDYAANELDAPTTTQLANALLYEIYEHLFDDEECAEEINVTSFPKAFPSAVNLTSYAHAIMDEYFNTAYYAYYYSSILYKVEDTALKAKVEQMYSALAVLLDLVS